MHNGCTGLFNDATHRGRCLSECNPGPVRATLNIPLPPPENIQQMFTEQQQKYHQLFKDVIINKQTSCKQWGHTSEPRLGHLVSCFLLFLYAALYQRTDASPREAACLNKIYSYKRPSLEDAIATIAM